MAPVAEEIGVSLRMRGGRPADVIAIVAAFVILSGAYNLLSPPFENPDEINHAEYAAFIAERGRVPDVRNDCVRMAFHPPLYYASIAPLAAILGLTTERTMRGHRLNPDYQRSHVILMHDDPGESFPYAGRARVVHVIRAVTMLWGLVVIVCTYALVLRVTHSRLGAVVGTTAVAAIPQFQYIASSINHDVMAAAFASIYLCCLARLDDEPAFATAVVGGAVLGLGLLVKSSVTVLAVAPLVLILRIRPRPRLGVAIVTLYASALLVAGWWYSEMAVEWGVPLPIARIHRTTWVGHGLMRTGAMSFAEVPSTLAELFRSFWFLAGLMNVAATPRDYAVWAIVSAIAFVGTAMMLRTRIEVSLVLVLIGSIVAILDYNRFVYSAQGRYLFLVLPAFGVAVARGVLTIPRGRVRVVAATVVCVALTVVAVTCVTMSFAPVYASLPSDGGISAQTSTPQLYCGNEYEQVVSSRGGRLTGLRLIGRRYGTGSYYVELRIDRLDPPQPGSAGAVSSDALEEAERSVVFRVTPVDLRQGERYRITIRAPQANPTTRSAFVYSTADADGLSLNGIPVGGRLLVEELLDAPPAQ
jgi:Dolichyl-phosphate-mannose-protein mannosyltransferase